MLLISACLMFVYFSNDPAITSLIKYKEFDELRHWHSGRPLTEEYERVRCNADGKAESPHVCFGYNSIVNVIVVLEDFSFQKIFAAV